MTSQLELGYGHTINLRDIIPKNLVHLEYHIAQIIRFAPVFHSFKGGSCSNMIYSQTPMICIYIYILYTYIYIYTL